MTEPALTPEEWVDGRITFPEPTSISADEWDLAYRRHPSGEVVWEYVNEGCDRGKSVDRPHAMAALCLFGQPFGFTQEDVAALLYTLDDAAKCGTDEKLASIAARIAALLPPPPA